MIPPAAFAVHQLRYLLAYGGQSGAELHRTGHSYLHSAVPWLVMLLGFAAGGFLRALGRVLHRERSAARYSLSLGGLWLLATTLLISIFACQEFLEGLFATGHPAGLAGVFGYGGWWAIPISACIGLVLAAWFHGARWVLDAVERRLAAARQRPRHRRAAPRLRPPLAVAPRLQPLALGASGRGPPA